METQTGTEEEVLAVADEWAEAMVSNDADRIAWFLADEWVIVHEKGVSERETLLGLIRSGDLTHSRFAKKGDVRVRIYGETALYPALRMAAVGLIGLGLYKYLKSRLVRERPYISLAGIVPGTRALDRYSFPSGHTLHAGSFTTLADSSFPELAWLLVPFAALIAASRVVLGLHYPSDVAAGALIGATLAVLSMVLFPLVG
jgi:undecaprenyl-diphosphatase